jgi:cell division septum initiation protein DivIVA
MGGKPLGLGWGLFGYRRSAVIQLIQDRDNQLSEAYTRVRAAEVRVGELEAEMASLRDQNARLEQHLELLRGQMVAIASRTQPLSHYLSSTPSVRGPMAASEELPTPGQEPAPAISPAAPSASQAMVTELARVLSAAEEGASRIIHQAAVTAQDQIARSTRAWRELKFEAARVDAWRQSMGPAITTVRSRLGDVKTRIDEIPGRIQTALAPLADAMTSIQEGLAQLSSLFGALSSPEWSLGDHEDEPAEDTAPPGPSPNGRVDREVIRLPEATSGPADEREQQDAAAWMRATVGY